MKNDDLFRFRHMLDSAREAEDISRGKSRSDLDSDRVICLAIVRLMEIIGEAAYNISAETKEQFPSIPWPGIINMRHRLVHGYYKINLDIVWKTLQEDLSPLIKSLEKILSREWPEG